MSGTTGSEPASETPNPLLVHWNPGGDQTGCGLNYHDGIDYHPEIEYVSCPGCLETWADRHDATSPTARIGPGKPGGDYRYRMTVSRSGKVNTHNYESQDCFYSLSVGFDDALEVPAIVSSLDRTIGRMTEALKSTVWKQHEELEGRIRATWGTSPTPPAKEARPPVSQREEKPLDLDPRGFLHENPPVEPATRQQVAKIMQHIKRHPNDKDRVMRFVHSATDQWKIKNMSKSQAQDLLLIISQ